jgi:hypothetical protein
MGADQQAICRAAQRHTHRRHCAATAGSAGDVQRRPSP